MSIKEIIKILKLGLKRGSLTEEENIDEIKFKNNSIVFIYRTINEDNQKATIHFELDKKGTIDTLIVRPQRKNKKEE